MGSKLTDPVEQGGAAQYSKVSESIHAKSNMNHYQDEYEVGVV